MGAKKSNKDRIAELERELGRYKYLAEAKQREVNARKEEVRQIRNEAYAQVRAAGMHVVALLNRLGGDNIFVSNAEIRKAAETRVYIHPDTDGFTIGLEGGLRKENQEMVK